MNTSYHGTPTPLGASYHPTGWNFAIYSRNPIKELVYAPLDSPDNITKISLDPLKNKTGSIWHIFVPTSQRELVYGYIVDNSLLLDPYAKLVASGNTWGNNAFSGDTYKNKPLGVAFCKEPFDLGDDVAPNHELRDLVIYEMHLRGLTMDATSNSANPGTYRAVIEKIPILKALGINAIELLPIFEFDESDCVSFSPKTKKRLYNYWGYQPLSFFCPMQRYATSPHPLEALAECKEMIKALHKANIEVILDIVFNHTGEGNEWGRTISWKGFADEDYYLKEDGKYLNYSGCGNTLNCNHPVVADMIIESLRYWVTQMHVDGFRFDLASILMRGQDGKVLESSPLLDRITQDGILSHTKLIAEPWDAAGLHQVGHFFQTSWKGHEQWMEWNDDFRTVVRQFIKGTPGYAGKFATKLCGSQDLYNNQGSPLNSINFVSCHDGFTLRDLVSYQQKYNEVNGEGNNDGVYQYDSWNCGVEGETDNPEVQQLRCRQMKNFIVALLISCGVPMLLMGDEYGHSKLGNNNTWCQDNELNWFQWDKFQKESTLVAFWQHMIQFRQENSSIRKVSFYNSNDITWHGRMPNQPDWGYDSHFLAYSIHDESSDIYVAFNASVNLEFVVLPPPPQNKKWHFIANTALLPPHDVSGSEVTDLSHTMAPFSSIVLQAL
ncbi:MAG: isoamylase [Chlamydiales bacterium]|nr:isoamylase [Chlamydiales bacterium]